MSQSLPPPLAIPFFKRKIFSITFKMMTIGIISLSLLMPLKSIYSLIKERFYRNISAQNEIGESWGSTQVFSGPILVIPYIKKNREWNDTWINGKFKKTSKITETSYNVFFMPEDLKISATMYPETRYRGLFKTLLYKADIQAKGNFMMPDLKKLGISMDEVQWNEIKFIMGVSDTRFLKGETFFDINGKQLQILPGTIFYHHELMAPLPDLKTDMIKNTDLTFSVKIQLAASKGLYFTPTSKNTSVSINSTWDTPSFTGKYLPDTRTVDKSGFKADWSISFLNHGFAQVWTSPASNLENLVTQIRSSAFGVDINLPVNIYQTSERSVKYGILFIILTFTTFFLFEILTKIRVHPIQYVSIGFALCLFYILLLGLSEHFSFDYSYLVSSISIIIMITFYSYGILKAKKHILLLNLLLCGLYAYLYILLLEENYSLLMGAVGLFAVLAVIMLITRKIDWYKIGDKKIENGGNENE